MNFNPKNGSSPAVFRLIIQFLFLFEKLQILSRRQGCRRERIYDKRSCGLRGFCGSVVSDERGKELKIEKTASEACRGAQTSFD